MNELGFETVFGRCRIGWDEDRLTFFRLPGEVIAAASIDTDETQAPDWVRAIIDRVRRNFRGELQDFSDVRLDYARLSSFRRAVYVGALDVKPGVTQTYGWLAKHIGHPLSASRAIGTALGQNPWPLLVPCHRFIGADGKMVGFSAPGGIQTKLRLLALEGAQLFSEH